MIWERVKSKVLYNIFVSLTKSKLYLSLAERAMSTPPPLPVSSTIVISHDPGTSVTTEKPILDAQGWLPYPPEMKSFGLPGLVILVLLILWICF